MILFMKPFIHEIFLFPLQKLIFSEELAELRVVKSLPTESMEIRPAIFRPPSPTMYINHPPSPTMFINHPPLASSSMINFSAEDFNRSSVLIESSMEVSSESPNQIIKIIKSAKVIKF